LEIAPFATREPKRSGGSAEKAEVKVAWTRAQNTQLSIGKIVGRRLLEETEDVQLTTLRDMLSASGLGHSRRTDGAELVAARYLGRHSMNTSGGDTSRGSAA
jgi:hypothetical protein